MFPSWCTVSAIDAFDAVVILEFSGDRERGLRELAQRFGINRNEECRETRRLAFSLLRMGLPSTCILARLHEQNNSRANPLPAEVVRASAIWCAQNMEPRHAAR
jgi:hypothetical protein